jgi:hypothetical protein
MRKLWIRRRGVETVIGGLIVLVLLLLSLIAMVVLTKQYDVYQSLALSAQLGDTERYSENLQVVFPGLSWLYYINATGCGGGTCNTYNLTLSNLGISLQIVRIYISSVTLPGCTKPCVINPNPSDNPVSFTFQASEGHINQGEYSHGIVFWLPWDASSGKTTLPRECKVAGVTQDYDCNSITVVTARGRQYSFQWPLSYVATSATGKSAGGTGIYIGPLVYVFQKALVTYTTPTVLTPPVPIRGTPYGYWSIPSNVPLIIYLKLQTDVNVTNDVYLTDQSVLELAQFTSPGSPAWFFIVAPITVNLCQTIAAADPQGDIVCDPVYGYDQTNSIGNAGNPNNLAYYLPCSASPSNYNSVNCPTARYRIPAPTDKQREAGLKGTPVVVAFSAGCVVTAPGKCPPGGGSAGARSILNSWSGGSVTTYLGLTYVWNDDSNTGSYVYGVTLPFVALCIDSCSG